MSTSGVEQRIDKPESEAGTYMHPKAYSKPETEGVWYIEKRSFPRGAICLAGPALAPNTWAGSSGGVSEDMRVKARF